MAQEQKEELKDYADWLRLRRLAAAANGRRSDAVLREVP